MVFLLEGKFLKNLVQSLLKDLLVQKSDRIPACTAAERLDEPV